ncbi:MAG: hypothetical protein IPI32_06385 [Austwickia sp.]|jgi:hypothetical protein|nr:hypothetical protein [Austwickia sp.]MBK8437299.1 hypothetical protein [Austwickia sp.]MBK9102541.1 hypothetical protein [Austwickia sp.]
MYGALWRALPGPWPVKAVLALALLALVVWACFQWLFPWVAVRLPVNDAGLQVFAVMWWVPGST